MPPIADGLIERALKAAVARARAESIRTRELLEALAGHRVAIVAQGTPFAALLESTGSDLRFEFLREPTPASIPDVPPDATVRGSPLSLLALSGPDPQAVINRGDVQISGNTEVAERFRELSLLLRPDLEHLLGGVFGRSLAHVFMRGLHGLAHWTRAAAWTSVQNLAEYLAHERGELVSRAEAEHFLRGVDELREQLDRIDARTAQLENHPRLSAGVRGPA
ncbi:MAG: SCP2 sterol-binding domain-containing protein [Steroidobacteraceae bacterium]